VVQGQDAAYQHAVHLQEEIQNNGSSESNRRLVWASPYDTVTNEYPLEVRVARHLATISELLLWLESEQGPIELTGLPDYGDLVDRGVGSFLASAASAAEEFEMAGIPLAE
jgi:hypothetical protein